MPYLGNEPAVAYTSTTKDSFSGDASTTDFTMSKFANVNAVRVVVENVVQNPTVAYTCSGTTLSFTSAPPTGTNNIYVVHLGPPAATIAPPTTINNATTFTGGVTLKNETPEDTDGGRESIVTFQGTQSGSEISTLAQIQASHDGTADDQKADLIFKTNDGSDNAAPTERLRIDSAGAIIPATLGTDNVKLGEGAGASITSGGDNNVAIGKDAGTAITTGDRNTAVGKDALKTITTSSDNTAIGYDALINLTTGAENTAVGAEAGDALTVGNGNVAVGVQALSTDVNGSRSTAVGATALKVQEASGTTSNNYYNTALGYGAGLSVTTGYYNTLLGSFAGSTQTTAVRNTFVGYDCAGYVTTGGDNLAIGYKAGMYQTNLTTGVGACLVGPYCDPTDGTANYSHGLGYNLDCAGGYTTLGQGSSDIRSQHGSTTWSTVSDERYKKDIVDSTTGLSFINNLKPRTFNYKTLGELPDTFLAYEKDSTEVFKSDKTQHGFIAQEVKTAVDADSSIKDGFKFWDEREDGSQEVAEAALLPVLVKAIQELSAKNDTLEAENTAIKARLDALEAG